MSDIEHGVSIYDYTELPAYEGLDSDNPMSPKYPIRMSITGNAVRFKMHYCVYRSSNTLREQEQEQLQEQIHELQQQHKREQILQLQLQQEKKHKEYQREIQKLIPENVRRIIGLRPVYDEVDSGIIVYGGEKPKSTIELLKESQQLCEDPGPFYGFSIDDIKYNLYRSSPNKSSEFDELNVVHIEEVILELSYTGYAANSITETIKKSYIAPFPQIRERNEDNHNQKTGNRFLDQLIENVFSEYNLESVAVSYSTLWLMDLYDKNGQLKLKSKEDSDKKKNLVDKFLRKLLLDFMFDLMHSDVFQTNSNYNLMFSGLMSNYYFSALMHKCEYYYYRELTNEAIKSSDKKKEKIKQLRKPKREQKKLFKNEDDKIIHLYAKELFEAEKQWVSDIRDPLSEELFEQEFPDEFSRSGKKLFGRWWTEICSLLGERMTTTCWDSWFANPEEEMRRVYFPYKSIDLCNSVTLIERFNLFFDESDVSQSMISLAQKSRGKSSRWFLNRYDFNDVLRLHLFKHSNLLFIILSLVFIICCLIWGDSGTMTVLQKVIDHLPIIILIMAISIISCQGLIILDKQKKNIDLTYYRFVIKKFWVVSAAVTFFLLLFILGKQLYQTRTQPYDGWNCIIFWVIGLISTIVLVLATIIPLLRRPKLLFMNVTFHPVKSIHLFLPKVIASIITAWFTLIVPSFMDTINSITIPLIIVIISVVFFFFLYLIDQSCPSYDNLAKVFRTFEFLIICYCISFAVGYIFIEFGSSNVKKLDLYNASALALFIGLFLRMIFRSQKQMTEI